MASKKTSSRKRSRPVEKKSKLDAFKKNKLVFGVVLIVVAMVAIAGVYLIITNFLPTNTAPSTSEDYSVITKNSGEIKLDLLANDIDADGDILNLVDIKDPTNGVVEIREGYAYYTPSNNFSGVDIFEYTINDEKGGETTSKVHVIVADEDPIALIDTTSGVIVVELYEDKVPNTVENFIEYANDGFYDGLVFHRVMDDFMIQGGGFYPDGTQKETKNPINLEIHDDLKHVDGAIAMARTGDPNSATSQFFINDGAQSRLEPGGVDPNGYAAFGVTIDGIEVVREIAALDPKHTTTKYGKQNWPVDDVIINSITIENQ